MEDTITKFLLLAPAILLAITMHEFAHALVAWRMGDDTARRLGRVSLNPLRHLDPMGTAVFLITAWMGMGFGWAKPVPFNYLRMKNVRLGFIAVSAAGPAANLLTALALGVIFHVLQALMPQFFIEFNIYKFLAAMVWINLVLCFFNLLPLPPLDGSGIVTGLLPPALAREYQRVGRYGIFILLALIVLPSLTSQAPDILDAIVRQPAQGLFNFLLR